MSGTNSVLVLKIVLFVRVSGLAGVLFGAYPAGAHECPEGTTPSAEHADDMPRAPGCRPDGRSQRENLTSGQPRVECTAPDLTPSHFLCHARRAAGELIAVPAVAVTYKMVTLTLERALYRGLGENSIGLSNAVPAANQNKLQDRNDLHRHYQSERFAG